MSNLPEAIQRQIEEAERLQQELYAQPEGAPVPVEPAALESEPVSHGEVAISEEVAPESVPEVQPQIKAKPGREDDVEYWQQRANTLYGMNQHQAGELHALKAQLQSLTNELADLKAAKPAEPEQRASYFSDQDKETFGADLVELVERGSRQAVSEAQKAWAGEKQQLLSQIQKLESQLAPLGQQVAESANDRFLSGLSRMVPDYEAINVDPGFLTWLGEADPVYGFTRQAALDNAAQRLDFEQVAKVFNAYKSSTNAVSKVQQKQQINQELQRQVAPSTTRSGNTPSAPEKIWTRAEFERAYDPRTIRELGSAKAEELVAEAERAAQEGRVRW